VAREETVRGLVNGTIPVRKGEELDVDRVRQYLQAQMEGLPDEPLEVLQFASGASNLTYLLRIGSWQGVLRRAPFGPLPPKAHDMQREARILSKLNPVFPLAPKPYLFCEDTSVIGSAFYVMERKVGVVLDNAFPPGYWPTPELGRKISNTVVDTLAMRHSVDDESAGLEAFGHPEGFLARQVNGWIERYRRARTDDVPNVDRVMEWLVNHLPESPEPTVIHNDYKLNNMLFDASDLSKVVAVVDWEMATIGDPLMDLAVTLCYWVESEDPQALKDIMPTVTSCGIFITRDEFLQRYSVKSGRDVSNMDFYMVLAYFKLAVILQQIYIRWKRGQTQDARFAAFGTRVNQLVQHAAEIIDRHESEGLV
jgi:aminoglycoside phosphotransferase (APT) family kinase protein